jgi:hypothetical protein
MPSPWVGPRVTHGALAHSPSCVATPELSLGPPTQTQAVAGAGEVVGAVAFGCRFGVRCLSLTKCRKVGM